MGAGRAARVGSAESLEREPLELVAEIVASYANTIVDVAHVRERARRGPFTRLHGRRDRYVIGEGPRADLTTTSEALSEPEGLALVHADAGGLWLEFNAAMRGTVRVDGRTRSFAELAQSGQQRVLLDPGVEGRIDRGPLQLRVRLVPYEAVLARRVTVDRRFLAYLGASACFGLALLGLLRAIPPQALAFEQAELRELPPAYQLAPRLVDEPVPSITEVVANHIEPSDPGAGAGPREPALRGRAGAHGSKRREQQPPGPSPERKEPKPRSRTAVPAELRRDHGFDLDTASGSAGLLGIAGEHAKRFADMSPAAFRPEVDDHELWESMTAGPSFDAYSVAGLSLIGPTPRGGGGLREAGLLDGGGEDIRYYPRSFVRCYHDCDDPRPKRRAQWTPTVRIEEPRVDGSLSTHALRRELRKHQAELIACVAKVGSKQLGKRAELTVNYAVTPTGAVATAVIDGSTLVDRQLSRCITRAFERWKFPPTPGGDTVLVVQEFEFGWKRQWVVE